MITLLALSLPAENVIATGVTLSRSSQVSIAGIRREEFPIPLMAPSVFASFQASKAFLLASKLVRVISLATILSPSVRKAFH